MKYKVKAYRNEVEKKKKEKEKRTLKSDKKKKETFVDKMTR